MSHYTHKTDLSEFNIYPRVKGWTITLFLTYSEAYNKEHIPIGGNQDPRILA